MALQGRLAGGCEEWCYVSCAVGTGMACESSTTDPARDTRHNFIA
jgi:hypothetical protein